MSEALLKEVRVRCSQQHAFETFTSRIDLWWPRGHRPDHRAVVKLDAQQNGRFYAVKPSGEEIELGRVLACSPWDRIRYTWLPGGHTGPTEVEVRFLRDGDSTLVFVRHTEGDSGLGPRWQTRAQDFAAAWDVVLPAFIQFIENVRKSDG